MRNHDAYCSVERPLCTCSVKLGIVSNLQIVPMDRRMEYLWQQFDCKQTPFYTESHVNPKSIHIYITCSKESFLAYVYSITDARWRLKYLKNFNPKGIREWLQPSLCGQMRQQKRWQTFFVVVGEHYIFWETSVTHNAVYVEVDNCNFNRNSSNQEVETLQNKSSEELHYTWMCIKCFYLMYLHIFLLKLRFIYLDEYH